MGNLIEVIDTLYDYDDRHSYLSFKGNPNNKQFHYFITKDDLLRNHDFYEMTMYFVILTQIYFSKKKLSLMSDEEFDKFIMETIEVIKKVGIELEKLAFKDSRRRHYQNLGLYYNVCPTITRRDPTPGEIKALEQGRITPYDLALALRKEDISREHYRDYYKFLGLDPFALSGLKRIADRSMTPYRHRIWDLRTRGATKRRNMAIDNNLIEHEIFFDDDFFEDPNKDSDFIYRMIHSDEIKRAEKARKKNNIIKMPDDSFTKEEIFKQVQFNEEWDEIMGDFDYVDHEFLRRLGFEDPDDDDDYFEYEYEEYDD